MIKRKAHELDSVVDEPNLLLLKPCFDPLLEFAEVLPYLRILFSIDEDADQVVSEHQRPAAPAAVDDLGFATYCAETLLQFVNRLGEECLGDASAVVKPYW